MLLCLTGLVGVPVTMDRPVSTATGVPGSTGGKTNGYTSDLRRLGGFLAPAPGAPVRIAPLSETFTGQVR